MQPSHLFDYRPLARTFSMVAASLLLLMATIAGVAGVSGADPAPGCVDGNGIPRIISVTEVSIKSAHVNRYLDADPGSVSAHSTPAFTQLQSPVPLQVDGDVDTSLTAGHTTWVMMDTCLEDTYLFQNLQTGQYLTEGPAADMRTTIEATTYSLWRLEGQGLGRYAIVNATSGDYLRALGWLDRFSVDASYLFGPGAVWTLEEPIQPPSIPNRSVPGPNEMLHPLL